MLTKRKQIIIHTYINQNLKEKTYYNKKDFHF